MRHALITAFLLASATLAAPAKADTFDIVKQRGSIICGVSQGVAGFSAPDDQGKWSGFDIDFCRAVSAAVFGDPDKVSYVPLSTKERFTALQAGTVDILSRQSTWTLSRDTGMGIHFIGAAYYDGQGFMVRKDLGVDSALKLSGATICAEQGTTTEQNVADYFTAHQMKYEAVVIDSADSIIKAFDSGRCDVYTTDVSSLAATRAANVPPPLTVADFVILPEIISKEPLGPMVRHGDNQFADIVRWSQYAMLEAEEYGINSKNVDEMLKSDNPTIKRILGTTPGMGKALGVDEKWVYNIVKQVGNYGESFEKHVGKDSPLKIERGLNKLWTQGGLQYAPPIR